MAEEQTIQSQLNTVQQRLQTSAAAHYEEKIERALTAHTDLSGVDESIEVNDSNAVFQEDAREQTADVSSESVQVKPLFALDSLRGDLAAFEDVLFEKNERNNILAFIDRLENRPTSVVVAGAFSAGKSTFINALLQRELMPSSPHPTTASLTTVSAPSGSNRPEQVRVRIKTRADLDSEIAHVSYLCNLTYTLESLKRAEGLSIKKTDTLEEKQWVEYLRALQMGVKKEQYEWGSTIVISLTEWQEMAVDEAKACLIDVSHVYVHTAWTDAGYELIDTPGVQSVHERHTALAMSEIEKADAFIYVTYYHHAFSNADEQFMKKIKTIQSPDYLLINASDLAADVGEKQAVMTHVRDQLQTLGFPHTDVVPISSKRALEDYTDEEGILSFTRHFENGLKPVLRARLDEELEALLRAHIVKLSEWQEWMDQPEADRKQKSQAFRQPVQQKKDEGEQAIRQLESEDVEIRAFGVYAHRRLFLRFADHYKSIISANVGQQEGRKEQLQKGLNEWMEVAENDWQTALEQECERLYTVSNQRQLPIDLREHLDFSLQLRGTLESFFNEIKTLKVKPSFVHDQEGEQFKQRILERTKEALRTRLDEAVEQLRDLWSERVHLANEELKQDIERVMSENEAWMEQLQHPQPDLTRVQEELQSLQSHLVARDQEYAHK